MDVLCDYLALLITVNSYLINNSSINAVSVKEKLRFPYEEMEIYSNLLHTKERQEIVEVYEAQCRMTGTGF